MHSDIRLCGLNVWNEGIKLLAPSQRHPLWVVVMMKRFSCAFRSHRHKQACCSHPVVVPVCCFVCLSTFSTDLKRCTEYNYCFQTKWNEVQHMTTIHAWQGNVKDTCGRLSPPRYIRVRHCHLLLWPRTVRPFTKPPKQSACFVPFFPSFWVHSYISISLHDYSVGTVTTKHDQETWVRVPPSQLTPNKKAPVRREKP